MSQPWSEYYREKGDVKKAREWEKIERAQVEKGEVSAGMTKKYKKSWEAGKKEGPELTAAEKEVQTKYQMSMRHEEAVKYLAEKEKKPTLHKRVYGTEKWYNPYTQQTEQKPYKLMSDTEKLQQAQRTRHEMGMNIIEAKRVGDAHLVVGRKGREMSMGREQYISEVEGARRKSEEYERYLRQRMMEKKHQKTYGVSWREQTPIKKTVRMAGTAFLSPEGYKFFRTGLGIYDKDEKRITPEEVSKQHWYRVSKETMGAGKYHKTEALKKGMWESPTGSPVGHFASAYAFGGLAYGGMAKLAAWEAGRAGGIIGTHHVLTSLAKGTMLGAGGLWAYSEAEGAAPEVRGEQWGRLAERSGRIGVTLAGFGAGRKSAQKLILKTELKGLTPEQKELAVLGLRIGQRVRYTKSEWKRAPKFSEVERIPKDVSGKVGRFLRSKKSVEIFGSVGQRTQLKPIIRQTARTPHDIDIGVKGSKGKIKTGLYSILKTSKEG